MNHSIAWNSTRIKTIVLKITECHSAHNTQHHVLKSKTHTIKTKFEANNKVMHAAHVFPQSFTFISVVFLSNSYHSKLIKKTTYMPVLHNKQTPMSISYTYTFSIFIWYQHVRQRQSCMESRHEPSFPLPSSAIELMSTLPSDMARWRQPNQAKPRTAPSRRRSVFLSPHNPIRSPPPQV